MKIHEEDFSRAIVSVKNCWGSSNLNFWTTTSVSRARSHDGSWNCVPPILAKSFVIKRSFLLHLNVIKFTFCVVCKIVDGIMVPLLLDSHMLMCNPLVLGSLCPIMLKGQWLNIPCWIQWPNYGWRLIFLPFWVKNLVSTSNWRILQWFKCWGLLRMKEHSTIFLSWRISSKTN